MALPLFRKLLAPRTPLNPERADEGPGGRRRAPGVETPQGARGCPTLPPELLPDILVHLRQTTDAAGGTLACARPDFATLHAVRLSCRDFAAEVVRQVPAYAVERNVAALAQQGGNRQLERANHLVLHSRGPQAPTPAFMARLPEAIQLAPRLRHLEVQGLDFAATGQLVPLLANLPVGMEGLQLPAVPASEQRQASAYIERFTSLAVLAAQRISPEFRLHAMPTSLRSLALTHHTYHALPPAILSLQGLEALDLSHGQLWRLPWAIEELQNLRTLRLTDNHLQLVPPAVGRLPHLTTLVVDDNALTELQFLRGGCASLQHLDANNNEIAALVAPNEMPKGLRRLIMHHNRLTDPWPALGACTKLEVVDLANNWLKNVPVAWIASVPLCALSLEDNRLTPRERGRVKRAAARRIPPLQKLRL